MMILLGNCAYCDKQCYKLEHNPIWECFECWEKHFFEKYPNMAQYKREHFMILIYSSYLCPA
jgi:hypothetical protein